MSIDRLTLILVTTFNLLTYNNIISRQPLPGTKTTTTGTKNWVQDRGPNMN